VREKREAATARRREALTGVSIFPNLREVEATVDAPFPAAKTAAASTFTVTPLVPIRLAQPFEALARCVRSFAGETRRTSESLPCHARHASGIRAARDLRQEFFRGRRHRGGERRQCQPRSPAGAYKNRRARLSPACVRPTRSMRKRRTRRRPRSRPPALGTFILAGRPGEREGRLAGGRRAIVHLRGLAMRLATLKSAYDIILGIEIG